MKKRILSLLLAVSIACSMLVVPANAAASNAAVQTAVTLGGLTSEQASALSTALTRGQLAKLLVAFSAYRESAATQGNTGTLFTDVDSGNEYAPYIRIAVQQGEIRIAAVARVMVDAEIDVAAELRHPVVLAEELEACHVHGHDDLGLELAFVQTRVGKRIPAGNGVGAEHRRCFVQRTERVVQGAAAANGIPIRVFVAQNQNVIRSQELFGHLLHIQLFCHPMIHPFRKAVIPRSPTALRRRSHSARGAAH